MSAKDRLLKNVLIFSIGNFGSRFLVFLLVPLFSFYLSTSEMGFYDMVVVTIGLIIPVASLQLAESIYRWLLDVEVTELKRVISTSFLSLFCAILAILVVYLIGTHFYSLEYRGIIGVYFIVMCLYPFCLAVARGMKKNKLYALSGLVNSAVLVIVNWVLLAVFSFGVVSLFIANILANIVSILLIIYGTRMWKYISALDFSKPLLSEFISYSLPLIPNAISWWFINSANRYIILLFLGQGSNGIYALSSRLAMALYAVNSIFNLAWQESAITEFNKEHRDKLYSETFNRYFILEMTLIILLIPLSKIYVVNFVAEAYLDSWKYIPILFIGVAFATFSTFFATGYMSAKKTIGAFSTTIIGAIVSIIIAWLLVPKIGLQGASIGLAIGFFVTWLLRVWQTRKFFKVTFDKWKMVWIMILIALALYLVFLLDDLYGLITFAIVSTLVFIFMNKSLIKSILLKIRVGVKKVA
ncbi:oligosaccharide flippase family protein [Sphingobacterium phlebotomi]|uniref:Oligosaccharide flippase family protein n=1 Tax=Sphingobacterium phlebotomi TaxID=2605433 RepID=A0A5D4H9H6_9SPHI|nr:oligosaccharide flippase family protein [Sphingobacterium phlebotomi]TYR36883.1 oligosaccharide flippase family protein [Sphingobacterium phlebotomi]